MNKFFLSTNIIVCPASVVQVWENQLKKHCAEPNYELNIYHGTSRKVDPTRFSTGNRILILLTSYNACHVDVKQRVALCQGGMRKMTRHALVNSNSS